MQHACRCKNSDPDEQTHPAPTGRAALSAKNLAAFLSLPPHLSHAVFRAGGSRELIRWIQVLPPCLHAACAACLVPRGSLQLRKNCQLYLPEISAALVPLVPPVTRLKVSGVPYCTDLHRALLPLVGLRELVLESGSYTHHPPEVPGSLTALTRLAVRAGWLSEAGVCYQRHELRWQVGGLLGGKRNTTSFGRFGPFVSRLKV